MTRAPPLHTPKILIVGGGAAGLSTAVHLVEAGLPGERLTVLEPRPAYTRDRTWSFWNTDTHPFEAQISHAWDTWEVGLGKERVQRSAPGLRYQALPADAFYTAALERLQRAGVDVRLGVGAHRITETPRGPEVETSAGPLPADWVLDSRPARWSKLPPQPGRTLLLQHFLGWEVETEHPIFDPSVATLMDFAPGREDSVHFTYVLPTSPTAALVEDTYFSAALLPTEAYTRALSDWLQRRGAGRYRVRYTEQGVLPMTDYDFPRAASPRVLRIGLAGGLAKPSTGYAFLCIQRDAAALAHALLHGGPLPSAHASRNFWMDAVFLRFLSTRSARAPQLFLRLFERLPAAALVRFLSERDDWEDAGRVLLSVPEFHLQRDVADLLWRRTTGA